jgi:hypothetical protein
VEYSSDVRILDYTKSKIGPLNLVCRCLVTVGRVNKFVMESEFIDAQVQAPNVLRDLMISRVRIYKIVKHYSIRLLGDFFSHVSIVHERHITVPPPPCPSIRACTEPCAPSEFALHSPVSYMGLSKDREGANMLSRAWSFSGHIPVAKNPFCMLFSVKAFFKASDTHCARVSLEAASFMFLDI